MRLSNTFFSINLHDAELRQLTGVCFSVFRRLERLISVALENRRNGRPIEYSVETMLFLTLMKLRGGHAYRTLSVLWHVPLSSLHRVVILVLGLLSKVPLPDSQSSWLIVDSTTCRVRASDKAAYSGYKHHKGYKVQCIAGADLRIVAVSVGYPASVHDKSVWNGNFPLVKRMLRRPVLADKAYAGAVGENKILFRPIKRNEKRWSEDIEAAKKFNRLLSKARVRVEHVFARMKAFRILGERFPLRPERIGEVFRSLAVIHNMMLVD